VGLSPYYLGDTSALARAQRPEVAARLNPLLEAGLIARCTPTDLEAGFSSTDPASHREMRESRAAWPFVGIAVLGMLLMTLFPGIITWLPGLRG